MAQLHERFTDQQVKELMQRYLKKELKREHIQQMLQIKRRQFFKLLKEYSQNPETFSIQYNLTNPTRTIYPKIEKSAGKIPIQADMASRKPSRELYPQQA